MSETAGTLPPELHILIFHYAAAASTRISNLTSLSLVATWVRDIVWPYIFDCVVLRDSNVTAFLLLLQNNSTRRFQVGNVLRVLRLQIEQPTMGNLHAQRSWMKIVDDYAALLAVSDKLECLAATPSLLRALIFHKDRPLHLQRMMVFGTGAPQVIIMEQVDFPEALRSFLKLGLRPDIQSTITPVFRNITHLILEDMSSYDGYGRSTFSLIRVSFRSLTHLFVGTPFLFDNNSSSAEQQNVNPSPQLLASDCRSLIMQNQMQMLVCPFCISGPDASTLASSGTTLHTMREALNGKFYALSVSSGNGFSKPNFQKQIWRASTSREISLWDKARSDTEEIMSHSTLLEG